MAINKDRLRKMLALLDENSLDYLLLVNHGVVDPNSNYLGFGVEGTSLLIGKNENTLLTSRMQERIVKSSDSKGVFQVLNDSKKFRNLLKGKRVGANFPFLTLDRKPAGVKILKDVSGGLRSIRSAKEQSEVRAIASACRIGKKIISAYEPSLFSGKTELQVAQELLIGTIKRGLEPAFSPIVATAGNSFNPHAVPGNRRVRGMCLIDYGVKVKGYCSDMTRCFFKSKSMRQSYEKAKQLFSSCVERIEQGATTKELVVFYEAACKSEGVAPLHSLGHGIGLEVHEYPFIRKNSPDRQFAGTCVAIEPGFYFAGKKFGVRFEQTIYVSKRNKVRIL